MKQIDKLREDRALYRALREKISQLEKMWLMDVQGNYELYSRRLRVLAKEKGITIEPEDGEK